MAVRQNSQPMEKQSNDYLRMSELLKKERPPDAIDLVRKVLDSSCSLDEKIRRIETIDAQDIVQDLEAASITDAEAQKIIRRQRVFTRDTAEKNIERIKTKSFRTPYFLFVIRDFLKVREFGKRTGTLSSTIFPPTVALRYEEYRSFMTQLKKEAEELLSILKFVMDRGWMHLDKLDFNLIGNFNILCELIKGYKIPQGRKDSAMVLERMKSIESYFLACNYQTDYPKIILAGIRTVLQEENRHRSHVELSDFLVRKMLFENRGSFCLYNLVLAMNMARQRKFLRMEDLIHCEPGGIVNTFDYDGSARVKERIAVFINDQVHMWRSLNRERAEIEKINLFLKLHARTNDSGLRTYDYKLIGEYYDFRRNNEQYRFSHDRENIAHTASNFFNLYIRDFENLLTGTMNLEGYGETRVFHSEFFQFETDQLRRYAKKLAEALYSCPYLFYDDFRSYKKLERDKDPSPAQLAVIQGIDALTETVVDIGRKTGAVCQRKNRDEVYDPNDRSKPEPLEISVLRRPEISTPMFGRTVLTPGYLKDKTVIDSLETLTTLSLLAGLYFCNPKLAAMLEREFRINEGIREARRNLKRTADAVTFEKIRMLDDIANLCRPEAE